MVTSGRPFQESHPMATVMTDVSLSGWGRLGRSIWAQVCGKQRKEIEIERSRNNRSSTSGKTERTGIFPVQPSQGLVPTALGRSLFPSIFERPYIELLVTADNALFYFLEFLGFQPRYFGNLLAERSWFPGLLELLVQSESEALFTQK